MYSSRCNSHHASMFIWILLWSIMAFDYHLHIVLRWMYAASCRLNIREFVPGQMWSSAWNPTEPTNTFSCEPEGQYTCPDQFAFGAFDDKWWNAVETGREADVAAMKSIWGTTGEQHLANMV